MYRLVICTLILPTFVLSISLLDSQITCRCGFEVELHSNQRIWVDNVIEDDKIVEYCDKEGEELCAQYCINQFSPHRRQMIRLNVIPKGYSISIGEIICGRLADNMVNFLEAKLMGTLICKSKFLILTSNQSKDKFTGYILDNGIECRNGNLRNEGTDVKYTKVSKQNGLENPNRPDRFQNKIVKQQSNAMNNRQPNSPNSPDESNDEQQLSDFQNPNDRTNGYNSPNTADQSDYYQYNSQNNQLNSNSRPNTRYSSGSFRPISNRRPIDNRYKDQQRPNQDTNSWTRQNSDTLSIQTNSQRLPQLNQQQQLNNLQNSLKKNNSFPNPSLPNNNMGPVLATGNSPSIGQTFNNRPDTLKSSQINNFSNQTSFSNNNMGQPQSAINSQSFNSYQSQNSNQLPNNQQPNSNFNQLNPIQSTTSNQANQMVANQQIPNQSDLNQEKERNQNQQILPSIDTQDSGSNNGLDYNQNFPQ